MSRLPWALCALTAAGCSEESPTFADAGPSLDGAVDVPVARCGDGIRVAGEVCFAPDPQRLVTENPPHDAQAADLDGDGDLDVFYIARGELRYHLNTGGVFPAAFTLGFAANGAHLVARDLDGDSRADLAISAYDELSFWRSSGASPPVTHQNTGVIDTAAGLLGLVLGDFDGDGRPELVALHEDYLYVGTLAADLTLTTGKGLALASPHRALAAGRFDADTRDDLLLASASGVGFLGGSNNEPVATAISGDVHGLATGDFDGDGHLDVFVAGGDTIGVALGHGDGTFSEPTLHDHPDGDALSAGDLDGDGLTDLAVLSIDGDLGFLLGHGSFVEPITIGGWADSVHVVGDLDGDAAPDIVVNDGEGEIVTILLSDP